MEVVQLLTVGKSSFVLVNRGMKRFAFVVVVMKMSLLLLVVS